MAEHTIRDFSDYATRNEILKALGFESYALYLRSGLWRSIRSKVFERDGHQCCKCGRRAQVVHHAEYTADNLKGTNTDSLVSLCWNCHEKAENPNGRKATLHEANRAIGLSGVPQSTPKPKIKRSHGERIELAKARMYDGERPRMAKNGWLFMLIDGGAFFFTPYLDGLARQLFGDHPIPPQPSKAQRKRLKKLRRNRWRS